MFVFAFHFAVRVTFLVGVYLLPAAPACVLPSYQPANVYPVLLPGEGSDKELTVWDLSDAEPPFTLNATE